MRSTDECGNGTWIPGLRRGEAGDRALRLKEHRGCEGLRMTNIGKVAVLMSGRGGLGAVERLGRAGAQGRSGDALIAEEIA